MKMDPIRKKILEEAALNMLAHENAKRKNLIDIDTSKSSVDLMLEKLKNIPEDATKNRILFN
jgi:hypothetical protein